MKAKQRIHPSIEQFHSNLPVRGSAIHSNHMYICSLTLRGARERYVGRWIGFKHRNLWQYFNYFKIIRNNDLTVLKKYKSKQSCWQRWSYLWHGIDMSERQKSKSAVKYDETEKLSLKKNQSYKKRYNIGRPFSCKKNVCWHCLSCLLSVLLPDWSTGIGTAFIHQKVAGDTPPCHLHGLEVDICLPSAGSRVSWNLELLPHVLDALVAYLLVKHASSVAITRRRGFTASLPQALQVVTHNFRGLSQLHNDL